MTKNDLEVFKKYIAAVKSTDYSSVTKNFLNKANLIYSNRAFALTYEKELKNVVSKILKKTKKIFVKNTRHGVLVIQDLNISINGDDALDITSIPPHLLVKSKQFPAAIESGLLEIISKNDFLKLRQQCIDIEIKKVEVSDNEADVLYNMDSDSELPYTKFLKPVRKSKSKKSKAARIKAPHLVKRVGASDFSNDGIIMDILDVETGLPVEDSDATSSMAHPRIIKNAGRPSNKSSPAKISYDRTGGKGGSLVMRVE